MVYDFVNAGNRASEVKNVQIGLAVAIKQPFFSPKQVALSLSVSESSIKRWCDRGIIPTVRTLGGHRRISLDGLQHFLRETDRTLANPGALGLAVMPSASAKRLPGSDEGQLKRFRDAIATGKEDACLEIVRERMKDGWKASEAAETLITDAMCGVGDAWNCGDLDVYQERRACGICLRLITSVRRELPAPDASAPIAIGAAPEGDPYEIATALVELALYETGWKAESLGCNLPLNSFLAAAVDCKADMVWMSVSSIENPTQFVADQNRVANSLDDDVALIVGGRALTDQIRPRLCYTAHCDSLRHLVELAATLRSNR